MPAYDRAELSAELKVVSSSGAERSPREQIEAVKQAASDSGLAHEAGPETTMLAGGRREVLEASLRVIEAALDAGAQAVQMKVEAEGEAGRFKAGG